MLKNKWIVMIAAVVAAGVLMAAIIVALSNADEQAASDGDDQPTVTECPVLFQVTFDDGDPEPWRAQGGNVALTPGTEGERTYVTVSGRAESWHGLESPVGAFTPGVMYDVSMEIRLSATADVRFIAYDEATTNQYNWVGTTEGVAGEWTTVEGTVTYTDEGAGTARLYIEVMTYDDYDVAHIEVRESVCAVDGPPPGTVVLEADFEDGLGEWQARGDDAGEPTIALSDLAFEGNSAAIVTGRTSQGSGIGHDVTEVLVPGANYQLTAALRFPEGVPTDEIWLTVMRTEQGEVTYDTLAQFGEIPGDSWAEVTANFTVGTFDEAFLYFETNYNEENTEDFLVDAVVIRVPEAAQIQDVMGVKETMDVPVGVAIDVRETTGSYADLLLQHFNQVSAENHMKPDYWYNSQQEFAPHADIATLMDFAADHDLGMYGHVLVWHSQTPQWFFERDGQPLTTSPADRQVLEDRMREHIFNVAQYLADGWGLYGSDTNPLVALDVINEVVDDSAAYADGLRRSEWYRVLGEEFIDLSFQFADEAFNDVYAEPGTDRPVTLFINDYNTEQAGKRARYLSLVERLQARGVPIDGVGHQFHVSLTMPVSNLEAAIVDFQGRGLIQAVTEFDVTTGTPVTDGTRVDQGYYYRDAFEIFRRYSADLYSVTVWGLYDARSWRSAEGGPLLFDDDLQTKPAYIGAVGGDLPIPPRVGSSFYGTLDITEAAAGAIEWQMLPLHRISAEVRFQTRWVEEYMTVFVAVDDATVDAADAVTVRVGDLEYVVARDGSGDAEAVVVERAGGYDVVVRAPFESPLGRGRVASVDVQVQDNDAVVAWNEPGARGSLSLYPPLGYMDVVHTDVVPVIDGEMDEAWSQASPVTTDIQVQGSTGGGATVYTLWNGQTLYALMDVDSDEIDVSGADPWIQDTVEIYVDPGNAKNGSYRPHDTQIRINADNVHSYGTGDEAFQAGRVQSATVRTPTGYRVEVAIDLLQEWGAGSFHGLDFQVNDARDGNRFSVRNWADSSDAGYQSTSQWGVGQLVAD